ncbi:hypothetical protein [Paenibacillus sp. 8b26]|uniref:hypothetical protein n=1 Tax=Paenibacillus sp. 8b26 TaxID=3424133 RepID=UPI003D64B359
MGLLPLDPSRVGQMRRVGCCLVVGSCCESRVVLVIGGIFPPTTKTRFRTWPPLRRRARPRLFASQRRGRAGQRSEPHQRLAYFFAL